MAIGSSTQAHDPAASAAAGRRNAADLPPRDLCDLLLLLLARRAGFGFTVNPGGGNYSVSVATRDMVWLAAALSPSQGQALVVRLGALAGLDLGAETQVGSIRVRMGGRDREFMVTLGHRPDGLTADVRRVADLDDAAPRPAARPADQAAQKLFRVGGYTLIKELGRGAMGIVYLGEHEALGRKVAIKVMSDRLLGEAEAAARFLREARAASAVRHRGVVDVTDFGILPDGRPFLAMELIEMPTLESYIVQGGMDPARSIRIAIEIANAAAAAHAMGIVHRDLKPANVFVGPDDAVKIGDFGSAKMLGRDRDGALLAPGGAVTGSLVFGTPLYMPPEQAQGLPADRRSDVYAIGCILFEMISGNPPFEGDVPREVIMRHINDPLPRLTSARGELPRGLEAVVRRALAKEPADRIQSAEDLALELQAVMPVIPPSPAVPTRRKWFGS